MFGRQPRDEEQPAMVDFDVHCVDAAAAQAEAARRQAEEIEPGVEWIYLHRDRDDQWVARRYTGQSSGLPAESRKKRLLREVVDGLFDPSGWFN